MKETIAQLIRIGKSTRQIQLKIVEFPHNVTTEYLKNLGFEEITAIKLKWKLRQNNKKEEEEINAINARKKLLEEQNCYRFSANANPNYIILDTCAILNKKGEKIIKNSQNVIIIESILEEIEKILNNSLRKKKKDLKDNNNINSIRKYKKEFAKKTKYQKVLDQPKEGLKYVDDKIIDYLKSNTCHQKPTLLTADINLANRAAAYDFDYILITPDKEEETKKINDKKNIHGITFKIQNDTIIVNGYNSQVKTYFIKDQEVTLLKSKATSKIVDIDYIVMLIKIKNNKGIKIINIKIIENQIIQHEEQVRFINEIYQKKLPEEIQESARIFLIK